MLATSMSTLPFGNSVCANPIFHCLVHRRQRVHDFDECVCSQWRKVFDRLLWDRLLSEKSLHVVTIGMRRTTALLYICIVDNQADSVYAVGDQWWDHQLESTLRYAIWSNDRFVPHSATFSFVSLSAIAFSVTAYNSTKSNSSIRIQVAGTCIWNYNISLNYCTGMCSINFRFPDKVSSSNSMAMKGLRNRHVLLTAIRMERKGSRDFSIFVFLHFSASSFLVQFACRFCSRL